MYTEKTVNGFLVGESEILEMNGTTNVPGPAIDGDAIGESKIVVGVEVTTAGGVSGASLLIEHSLDGVNFTAPTTVIADIGADQTGVKLALADLTVIKAPYHRLTLGGVTSLGTAGRFKLLYAAPGSDIVS